MAFLALPGVFISLEKQLADLPLCALLAAAIVSLDREQKRACWVSLALTGLVCRLQGSLQLHALSPLLLIQLFQDIETGSLLLLALMLPRPLAINVRTTFLSILHFLGR